MLSYKRRTSGRKGLSRARLFTMKGMFFCGAFFRNGVLSWGVPLQYVTCPLLPIAVPNVSEKTGHSCTSGLSEVELLYPLGTKVRLMLGRSCCKEEEGQTQTMSVQSCVLPTQGHSHWISLGQWHCRWWGRAKNIWHFHTKLFLLFLLHKSWLLWRRVHSTLE